MEIVRLLAIGLIFFSCSAGGFLIATSFSQRVQNVRELLSFIQFLESEIRFAHSTLPAIISKESQHYRGATKDFLLTLHNGLSISEGSDFFLVWEQGLTSLQKHGFSERLLEDLRDLGKVLGQSDLTEQLKYLQLCTTRLEQSLEKSKTEQHQQERLWRYLGVSAGFLLVLLFI